MGPPPKYGIETSALLAELSIRLWTARRLDKGVTIEVNQSKQSVKDAARVNKNLLAGRAELERVTTIAGKARTYFYKETLPWSDSGLRLLPSIRYFDFVAEMGLIKEEFDKEVKNFIQAYPTLITAQAMALGAMFNRAEYPHVNDISKKFWFNVAFYPVPTKDDWRIRIGDEAQEELIVHMEQEADRRLNEAMADVWERIKLCVEHMIDRLDVEIVDGKEKPKRFHDSLISNAYELVDLLKGFNVTGDPELEKVRQQFESIISGKNSDMLRDNLETRKATQDKLKSMMDKLSF